MVSLIDKTQLRNLTAALVPGALGAALASWLHMPAPFITGPAIAVTLTGLSGVVMAVPVRLRDFAFVVIGLAIGTSVTPEILTVAGRLPVSLAALAVSILVIILASQAILSRWWGKDRRTAMMAAIPGQLSFVLSMTDAAGLDVRLVAIIQSMRLFFLTLVVPAAVLVLGDASGSVSDPPQTMTVLALAANLTLAVAVCLLLVRIRAPAAYLLGGMSVTTVTHLTGLAGGALPGWLATPAFILLGTLIGTRFSGVRLHELRLALAAGFMVTAIGVVSSIAAALFASWATGLPVDLMLISLAPGGVETMAAMAQQLHADPTIVTTHHIARLYFLAAIVPFIFSRQQTTAG